MTDSEYIESRLENQINWYDTKSQNCQKNYKRIKIIQLISSALIPFLAGIVPDFKWLVHAIGLLGILIAVLEGINSINKYHENWIEYRSICETLRREKHMYLGKAGVYSESGSYVTLIERVETIISKENINWANLNHNDNRSEENG
ncbi:hypothetical protein BTO30_02700 [Domibacillus antri]|uniref:DUF4231 domain-containing protein n=1 Tax=Domibacillus antri TaxID=1714264 RepID=A0A1Q8Q940_9BACI|nr:DUF4231 domain-containing protein [Domibacillus antri]OLN23868.1 hypothetical protein BTO30_02700 [Domibacillus antri]